VLKSLEDDFLCWNPLRMISIPKSLEDYFFVLKSLEDDFLCWNPLRMTFLN
jgi:hypothetical protein